MSIGFKTKDKKIIIELVQWLINEKLTGEYIMYGTYFLDYYPIEEVKNLINNENIVGISVCNEDREENKVKYSHLFNDNGILVSLITYYDMEQGDVPKNFFEIDDFKDEVKKMRDN